MDLEKIFEHMSKKMMIEWDRIKDSLSHAGLKGSSLENEFKKFLKDYIPRSLAISNGIMIDSSGNESRQLDVIIYDALKTPLLFNEDDIRVVPVECVYAVIEVKANIDSNQKVNEIFENMKSVKDLKKSSYVRPLGMVKTVYIDYGKECDILPIHYFVFALDSMKLTTIADELAKKNQKYNREVSKRVDCICVLNKGVILNQFKNGKLSGFPEPDSVMIVSLTKKPLLFFYRLISNRLFQYSMPAFLFDGYTEKIRY